MTDLAERRGWSAEYYEPAEDSYLLASACTDHIDAGARVLDVGTGSGFVAASIREACNAEVVGIDVNPHACRRAARREIPVVRGDTVAPFRTDTFDVVVTNPPYLPTGEEEERDDWLAVAVAGGPTGRTFVNEFLAEVGRVLRTSGQVFLLVSSLMDVDAVRSRAADEGFVATEIARDESFPFEVLSVLELQR